MHPKKAHQQLIVLCTFFQFPKIYYPLHAFSSFQLKGDTYPIMINLHTYMSHVIGLISHTNGSGLIALM